MRFPEPVERPTLTIEEAGRLLGLGRAAAYAAAKRGELPTIKFGRKLLVPTAALRRLVGLDDLDESGGGEVVAFPQVRPGGASRAQ